MTEGLAPSAEFFDAWYAQKARSPAADEIHARHLGLPSQVLSSGLLTAQGVAEVIEGLRLAPGDTLVDLACGRGGYGLEVSRRVGVRLIGVDFSAEAVRQAGDLAARLGRDAEFRAADLTATGLRDAIAHGVMCIDSIQFVQEPAAAYSEIRRILVPGGRVVLTSWEIVDGQDDRVPKRLRAVDLRGGLLEAGFASVQVLDRPQWRAAERSLWEEAASMDPGQDRALQALHEEAVLVLDFFDLARRVIGTATAPDD
jgi:SAM-dependent methyltransferase